MGKTSKHTKKKGEERPPTPPPEKKKPEELPEDPEFSKRPGLYGYRGAVSQYIKNKLVGKGPEEAEAAPGEGRTESA
jgi:hypothetical protein